MSENSMQSYSKNASNDENHIMLDQFKELVNDYYTEPTDEEIFGSF